ncbi:cytochrome c biogenesis protein CcsA [Dactylosporangium aurantiacum]|uniref:Cytochrome c biogenesis protein CcsA n=1 Tax=Dactylosporangium aurantiacum TaxID=35754 RepID=A0A9Q9MMX6_9ACTN|nr:cytochrome c-type biogenesis CcmF C-terminal domain-containing protein [Dactylosporangium aurantiacum]MDG6110498.1 cytochrome c-type biogenesis CcmF C-terminal domain-containing protein [Dactylosporangium aurantiacum]UWZ58646.1 cytochrome c biogenesis protein CcsA [Dactylosporangium aurantiacum]
MTAHVGALALGVGVLAATLTALLWLRVALLGRSAVPARAAGWLTLAAAAGACATLEAALLRHDFGVRYVAENGGRGVPVYFTVTSLWAALDGSLLLWLLVLTGCAVLIGRSRVAAGDSLQPWASTVLAVVTVFFFALTYFAANPFTAVEPAPADGPGPNPLLRQHPAMGLHPPILYAGYVAMAVPFAYGVAALLAGRNDPRSVARMRRWTLVAWSLLAAGITLGAWWSYAVLGWGGYWAWDPVENASLLPWLAATALLHTLLPAGQTAWLRLRSIVLACSGFLLVLTGTLLTRSGALNSVHTFSASALGPMLLGFLLLSAAGIAVIALRRPPQRLSDAPARPPGSRPTVLSAGVLLLVTLGAVVLTGTLFPLAVRAMQSRDATVGPAFYGRAAVPLALALLAVMGLAPILRIRRAPDFAALRVPAAVGLAAAAAAGQVGRPGITAIAGCGLGAFVLAGLVPAARRRLGGHDAPRPRHLLGRAGWLLAHAGLAVIAIGVAVSSGFGAAAERQLKVGDRITTAGVTAVLTDVSRHTEGDTMTVDVHLRVHQGATEATVVPELRYYPARDATVSVPAIRSRPTGDVYATVLGVTDDGSSATVRLATNPLVPLIWFGGGLLALGGLLSALRSLRRPRRVAARATGTPPVLEAAS